MLGNRYIICHPTGTYAYEAKQVRMDDASGERVQKVIETHNINEERLYLGGYEH